MSNKNPEPTELDDKDLEQATGGQVTTGVTYKPVAQTRSLNRNAGGITIGSSDTGIVPDRGDPDLL